MKKGLLLFAAVVMVVMSAKAQRIRTVDSEGKAIPLVSVLTEDGTLIGTTGMDGVLADVKGAKKIALTHVAYKPQMVTVAELHDGCITMTDVDYDIEDVVVKPKPYLYIEYYYRAFRYIGDSLRAYSAGIYPVIYEISKGYKPRTRTHWSSGTFANKAASWHGVGIENTVEDWIRNSNHALAEKWLMEEKAKEKYRATLVPQGDNNWVVEIPEHEVVGQIIHSGGLVRSTLDGARMQMYSNEIHGQEKLLKRRQEKDYAYRYTEIYDDNDDENVPVIARHVMTQHHWEYNDSKGRIRDIFYIYTTDHSYVEWDDFKARSKELNHERVGDMSFEELQVYATEHHIPELATSQLQAILALKKKR
jgi:hypothetical protein